MSKRRWTIIVVPQGSSASRVLDVSYTALKLVGSLAVAAALIAVLLGYATVRHSLNLARADRVEHENLLLANELNLLRGRVSALSDTVSFATPSVVSSPTSNRSTPKCTPPASAVPGRAGCRQLTRASCCRRRGGCGLTWER